MILNVELSAADNDQCNNERTFSDRNKHRFSIIACIADEINFRKIVLRCGYFSRDGAKLSATIFVRTRCYYFCFHFISLIDFVFFCFQVSTVFLSGN